VQAGAQFVVLSAPARSDDVLTVVHGVNHQGPPQLIFCASCTTNCITPLLEDMGRRIGVERASVVDLGLTMVVDGSLVKVMSWYDNEWGFTHQMVREARSVLAGA